MTSTTETQTTISVERITSSIGYGDWVKASQTDKSWPNLDLDLDITAHPKNMSDNKISLDINGSVWAYSNGLPNKISGHEVLNAKFTREQLTMLRDVINLALDIHAEPELDTETEDN